MDEAARDDDNLPIDSLDLHCVHFPFRILVHVPI